MPNAPAQAEHARDPLTQLQMDDSELLAALKAGDAGVATAFHDRVRPQVERTVRRLLGAHDADFDDAMQTALVELVMTIDRYRGESSLDSWASMIAARAVYKRIRRRQLERRVFDAAANAELEQAGTEGDASQRAANKELLDRVYVHLAKLEPSRAWAFLLHDAWGFDLKECARIMDVSVAAAQSRVIRGRRDIHAHIAHDASLAALFDASEGNHERA